MKATIAVLVACVTGMLASCSKDNNSQPVTSKAVQLKANATLGTILTDRDGKTLYYFANDAGGTNTCTGGCEAVWPVFNADNISTDSIDAGLDINDFKAITTLSGKKQLSYKGHPLYYYAPAINGVNVQEAAGATTGEAVGGVWFVAKPDYTIMLANAQLVGHDTKNYTSAYVEGTGKTVYFTDARGLTLYTFKNDKKDSNSFTKADFSNNGVWPVFEEQKIVVPSILDKTLFGTISVFTKKQMTYKGWPLYYFGQDNKVQGANKGISFPSPGIWPVPVKDIAAAVK
ncbi:MAG: hypothetical protein J0I41_03290 [Filimonas sp.]|nr:hypothetical protein [Filimonas sp.]